MKNAVTSVAVFFNMKMISKIDGKQGPSRSRDGPGSALLGELFSQLGVSCAPRTDDLVSEGFSVADADLEEVVEICAVAAMSEREERDVKVVAGLRGRDLLVRREAAEGDGAALEDLTDIAGRDLSDQLVVELQLEAVRPPPEGETQFLEADGQLPGVEFVLVRCDVVSAGHVVGQSHLDDTQQPLVLDGWSLSGMLEQLELLKLHGYSLLPIDSGHDERLRGDAGDQLSEHAFQRFLVFDVLTQELHGRSDSAACLTLMIDQLVRNRDQLSRTVGGDQVVLIGARAAHPLATRQDVESLSLDHALASGEVLSTQS